MLAWFTSRGAQWGVPTSCHYVIDRVRRVLWGIMYADDADIASKFPEGLEKVMTVIVIVFEAAGLTV